MEIPMAIRRQSRSDLIKHVEVDVDVEEFTQAMERYKRENRRPFPTADEVLKVVLSLGYRKVSP